MSERWRVADVRGIVCLSLQKESESLRRAREAVPLERSFARVLGQLPRAGWLTSFVSCVKELISVKGVRVLYADLQIIFVESRFISAGFCSIIRGYGGALSVLRAESIELFVLCEQKGLRSSRA